MIEFSGFDLKHNSDIVHSIPGPLAIIDLFLVKDRAFLTVTQVGLQHPSTHAHASASLPPSLVIHRCTQHSYTHAHTHVCAYMFLCVCLLASSFGCMHLGYTRAP